MVQWLRLCAPGAERQGSIPGQGTRFRILQRKSKSPRVSAKTQCSQTNSLIKKHKFLQWRADPCEEGNFERQVMSCVCVCVCVCLVMSDSLQPHGLYPPGSTLHGIFQERILDGVAISYSKGSSPACCLSKSKLFLSDPQWEPEILA